MSDQASLSKARVIILDADGVFRRLPNGSTLEGLEAFEAFLRLPEFLDVLLVAAGQWKDALPLQQIKALFSDDISARLVGVTPEVKYTDECQAHVEISSWLDEHPEIAGYVVVESSAQAPLPPVTECGSFVSYGAVFSEAEYSKLASLLGRIPSKGFDRDQSERH